MKAASSLKDVLVYALVLLVGAWLSSCQGLSCEEPPLKEEIENAIARGATMLRVQAVEGESGRRELPCGIGAESPYANLSLYKVVTVFQGNITQPFVHLMKTWPSVWNMEKDGDFLVTLGKEILDCCTTYNLTGVHPSYPPRWCLERAPFSALLKEEEIDTQIFAVSECGSRPEWSSLSSEERGLLEPSFLESSSCSDIRTFMARISISIGLATMFMAAVWK